jgi:hypothetical protein
MLDHNTVHPKAFLFIGAPSVFPTQKSATLEGVYVANQPSLGRLPFGVFTSDVQLFAASLNPRTENMPTRLLGIFAVLDNISHINDAAPGAITDDSVWTSFSYNKDPSLDLISNIGLMIVLCHCLLSCI